MKIALPPLTNPFVAIAEVDSPVIVVTTVAIPITKTDRPFGKRGEKHCKHSSIQEYKPSTGFHLNTRSYKYNTNLLSSKRLPLSPLRIQIK